jgi:hypothetical protein
MKIARIITMLALVETAGFAASGLVQPAVTVFLKLGANIPVQPMLVAQNSANKMFAKAGVRINWQLYRSKENEDQQPIIVEITSGTAATFYPGALAYAEVFGGSHVIVFYDRIDNPCCPHATGMLLAHVLVHEITHILQGVDRHSKEGVMKARWTDKEVLDMAWRPLPFASEDIGLIHAGLSKRNRQTSHIYLTNRRQQKGNSFSVSSSLVDTKP